MLKKGPSIALLLLGVNVFVLLLPLAAITLYRSAGFSEVGRRRGYYDLPRAAPLDALVMRRALI